MPEIQFCFKNKSTESEIKNSKNLHRSLMAKFTEIRHGMFLDEAFQAMNVL